MDQKHIQIVVAKYQENMDFLQREPFSRYSQLIYDKSSGGSPDEKAATGSNVVFLPNVGRESHTYLYHIIENYDNLADITIFLPGSCMDTYKKWQTKKTLELVERTHNTVFVSSEMVGDIKTHLYNWCLDEYVSTNANNAAATADGNKNALTPADIRPFGKWFEYEFGDLHTHVICYRGIFALSREHIRHHSKKYYQQLIQYLNTSANPEYGHYFERAWLAIFYPIHNSCVF